MLFFCCFITRNLSAQQFDQFLYDLENFMSGLVLQNLCLIIYAMSH